MIHHASCMHAAKKLEISAMSNPCQIPFPPVLGPDPEEDKKREEKKDILECVWSMHTYIHTYMHVRTPFYPQLPTLPTPILHTANTNERIHYAPHTHTHVLLYIHHLTSTDIIPGCITQLPTYICAYYQSARAQQRTVCIVLVHVHVQAHNPGLAYIADHLYTGTSHWYVCSCTKHTY